MIFSNLIRIDTLNIYHFIGNTFAVDIQCLMNISILLLNFVWINVRMFCIVLFYYLHRKNLFSNRQLNSFITFYHFDLIRFIVLRCEFNVAFDWSFAYVIFVGQFLKRFFELVQLIRFFCIWSVAFKGIFIGVTCFMFNVRNVFRTNLWLIIVDWALNPTIRWDCYL